MVSVLPKPVERRQQSAGGLVSTKSRRLWDDADPPQISEDDGRTGAYEEQVALGWCRSSPNIRRRGKKETTRGAVRLQFL